VRDCLIPRRPWCAHCRNNTHAIEDCPNLTAKWEYHTKKRRSNIISSKPRPVDEERRSNINIVTRGGAKTNANMDIPHQIKIQKVLPETTKYDLVQHKEFFKNAVEMFKWMPSHPILELVETSLKLNSHQPRIAKESSAQIESLGKY
jgi:hypothetical protein